MLVYAEVVELADTYALGAYGGIPRAGSSPVFGILLILELKTCLKKLYPPSRAY